MDDKLVALTERLQGRLLTLDANLQSVAKVRGQAVVDLERASDALRRSTTPGARFELFLEKEGEQEGQAVGRLPDGTMVVVENAIQHVGNKVMCEATNTVKTNAGQLIFAQLDSGIIER